MAQPRRLIFVGAHPDDESFGPGATLAHYALQGVQVYYACATRGEMGEAKPEFMAGHATPADMRWAELMCAAKALHLTDVIHLGYRDSGMPGAESNQAEGALAAAPLDEVTGRVVKVLRELRPQVILTFDPIGGYRHPDHIAIHRATVEAFSAAADPVRYPLAGPAYTPQKLYFATFPNRVLKMAVRVLPLLGRDPRKFGTNGDIDLVSLTEVEFPIHAVVPVSGAAKRAKDEASACHRSQLDEAAAGRSLFGRLARLFQGYEPFMRAQPPVMSGRLRERDLFEGVAA